MSWRLLHPAPPKPRDDRFADLRRGSSHTSRSISCGIGTRSRFSTPRIAAADEAAHCSSLIRGPNPVASQLGSGVRRRKFPGVLGPAATLAHSLTRRSPKG